MAFRLSVKVICVFNENIYKTEIYKMKEAVITCVVTMPFQSFFSVNAADNLNLPLHSVASGRDKKLVRASVLF